MDGCMACKPFFAFLAESSTLDAAGTHGSEGRGCPSRFQRGSGGTPACELLPLQLVAVSPGLVLELPPARLRRSCDCCLDSRVLGLRLLLLEGEGDRYSHSVVFLKP